MAGAEDVLRRDLAVARMRADAAQARAAGLLVDRDVLGDLLGGRDAEIRRLQEVIARQGEELARLTQQVQELEELARRTTLDAMLAGVLRAIEHADAALDGRTVSAAAAELRVALAPGGPGGALSVAAPSVVDPTESLSTVRVDVRQLPPSPAREDALRAAADVRAALGDLQAALAGDLPRSLRPAADRALAQVSLVAGDPTLAPETAAEQLAGVLDALGRLGRRRKGVAARVAQARRAHRNLEPAPSAAALHELAVSLRAAASSLRP